MVAIPESDWERKMVGPQHFAEWITGVERSFSFERRVLRQKQVVWREEKKDLYFDFGGGNEVKVRDTLLKAFKMPRAFFDKLKPRSKEYIIRDYLGTNGLSLYTVFLNGVPVGFNEWLTRPYLSVWQEANYIAKMWPGKWKFDRLQIPNQADSEYGFWMINTDRNYNDSSDMPFFPGIQVSFDPTYMHLVRKMVVLFCMVCSNGLVRSRACRNLTGVFVPYCRQSVESAFSRLKVDAEQEASGIMGRVHRSREFVIEGFQDKLEALMRMIGVSKKEHVDRVRECLPGSRHNVYDVQYRLTEAAQGFGRMAERKVNQGMEKMLREFDDVYNKPFTRILSPVKV